MLFLSCRTTYTSAEMPPLQLRFGSGGGFTGAVSTWCLLENGQLFWQENAKSEFVAKGRASRKAVKAVFAQAEELGLLDAEISQPGNMYSFIEMKTDTGSGKATWGDPSTPVNPDFQTLYQSLMDLTN